MKNIKNKIEFQLNAFRITANHVSARAKYDVGIRIHFGTQKF